MRRRNLVVTSDSDEEDGERTTTTASVSVSVASGGGGGGGSGSVGRPSPPNPSPLPVPFPSFSPTSAPVVISDDEEEEVEEILDSDGDSPFIDVPEDFSPPSPPAPPPPAARTTTSAPPPLVARTPTSAPPHPAAWTPTSAPPAPAARTPTPAAPFPAARTPTSAPPSAQTPAPTPPPARTPTPTAPPASTPPPASLSGRLRPVYELLRRLGLRLRPEWLESWAAGVPGFDGLGGPEGQARRCFEQFLFADMNACGAGVLPEGVGSMHAAILDGPFVLQVDEIVNISAPLRERYHGAHVGPKRCLKLSMTDGIQRIFGMEYRPIKELEVLAPAGLKILIRNVHIRRGLLMLVPEVIEILGGVVDELEAARDRLVSEVNKPPRGKRKQGGLPLSSRATLAAWPCSTNVTNGGEQGISMPRAVNSSYTTGLGNAFPVGRTTETIVEEHVRPPVVVNSVQEQSRHVPKINMQDQSTSLTRENTETRRVQEINMQDLSTSLSRENTEAQRVQEISMQDLSTFTRKNTETWRVQEINMLDLSTSLTRKNTEAQGVQEICTHSTDRVTQTIIEEYVDPPIIANSAHEQIQRVQEITMQEQATAFARTETRSSAPTPCEYDSHHGSHGIGGTGANDVEAARSSNLDDEIYQMEHSFILSGENEKPYTYIYSMLADWGMQQDIKAYIQGKIKGLITSVKSFQYKRRIEYELYVYIDDGSYISEAFVDNDIVKNMLGLSPGELTAALAGESELASASEIKETMKGFQRFLVKFEGTMLVEFNKNSSIPIVRELSEGCSSSDAWLLLRRLKTFSSERHMQNLDIMDTTP